MEVLTDTHLKALTLRITEVKNEFLTLYSSFVSRENSVLQQLMREKADCESQLIRELSDVTMRTDDLLSEAKTHLKLMMNCNNAELAEGHQQKMMEKLQEILIALSDKRKNLRNSQLNTSHKFEVCIRDEKDLIKNFNQRTAVAQTLANDELSGIKRAFFQQMNVVCLSMGQKLNRKVKTAELSLADNRLDHQANLYGEKSRFQRELSTLEQNHQKDMAKLREEKLNVQRLLETQLAQLSFDPDVKRLSLTTDIKLLDQTIAQLHAELKKGRKKQKNPKEPMPTETTSLSAKKATVTIAKLQHQIVQLESQYQQLKIVEKRKFTDLREYLQSQLVQAGKH